MYGLKGDLIVRLELNSAEKVILCNGDISATYKLSDISLEYDPIFDEQYSTTIGGMYINMSIPYTKITSKHYQTLSKKDTIWKIDVNSLDTGSSLLLMMMMDCFCDMVDRRKTFSLNSSQNHCQRSSPSRISDTPRAGFEPSQNLSSGFVE